MKKLLDVPYSQVAETDGIRKIDIFLPDEGNANGCAMLFVHGGGWSGGRRAAWHAVMERFAGFGFACFSPGYHLLPDWRFPKQIEDVRLAMSFVRSHAADFGFAPDRIASWGSSAGGHLAALLATIRPGDSLGATAEMKLQDTVPNAVVCLCSVLTLVDYPGAQLADVFEKFIGARSEDAPDLYRAASPLLRLTGQEPPFLLVTGDQDPTTPVAVHEQMRDALAAHGIVAEHHVLPGVAHGYGYGATTPSQIRTIELAREFLTRVFAIPRPPPVIA